MIVGVAWETQIVPGIYIRKAGTQEFHLSMIMYDQAVTQVVSSNVDVYSQQFE